MHIRLVRKLVLFSLLNVALLATQACSSLPGGEGSSVADAYRASDAVAMTHYSRTIFSSNNF